MIWAGFVLGSPDGHEIVEKFTHHIPDIAGILTLFSIGAMTIVELIDLHQGFDIVVNKITTRNKRKLLWILGFLTFFLSAVLDNLTTAIVMISLLCKIIKDKEEKMLFAEDSNHCGQTLEELGHPLGILPPRRFGLADKSPPALS